MKRRIDAAIKKLETNPYVGKTLRGELMGKRSLRVGDYRVIYMIDEPQKTVILFTVEHRKAVYE